MHRSSLAVRVAPARWWVAWVVTMAAGAVPAGVAAQGAPAAGAPAAGAPLRGIVLTTAATPVAGATVTLALPGRPVQGVVTAEDGLFTFPTVEPATAVLRVRRLGFTAESLAVALPHAGASPLAIQLSPTARELAPVVVRGVRDRGPIADFYRRRETGFGRYIARAEIERRNPTRTTDLLRTVAGVAIHPTSNGFTSEARVRGSRCAPEVYVDGTPTGPAAFDFDAVPPSTVEGIEIYSSSATVPAEFSRPFGRAACGTVLLWTRRGEARPRRAKGKPVTSADLARLVEELQIFTAEQVEHTARPTTEVANAVRLPPSLQLGAAAAVVAEFVVDGIGQVEASTINVVAASGAVYAAAVRAALLETRFTPAQRAGRAVRQLVQLQVRFEAAAASR